MTYLINNGKDVNYSENSGRLFDARYPKKSLPLEALVLKKNYNNTILNTLSKEEQLRLVSDSNRVSLFEGEILYHPGDKIDYIYFPETAVISEFCVLEDGRTIEIGMIGKEGLTGQSAFYGMQTAPQWTQVSVAGRALKVKLETIKKEFSRYETLHELLLNYANLYMTQISNRVICNNYHVVEKRFCSWLLMLCDRHGSDKFMLTHSHIASYLGIHRPSLTHVAKKFRQKELIDYSRGNLSVLNRSELRKYACDCYAEI